MLSYTKSKIPFLPKHCSVFLVDEDQGEYVLSATDGLNKKFVGQLRLKFGEGLVGLVGERGEPINLEEAPTHPNFKPFPNVGDDKFQAFLGVPITHSRKILGVINCSTTRNLVVLMRQKKLFW